MTQEAQARDDLWVILEGCVYLIFIALGAIALQLKWISLGAGVRLSVYLLTGLLLLAWKRFDGGRHPCFLFLGMLIIFQGGRLIGYTCGVLDDPFQLLSGTTKAFDISQNSSEITLLLILVSAICVYLPCRWRFKPVKLEASRAQRWLPAAYFLLLLTFPFMVYKNYLYLSYVRSHGGYIAVYTDSDAIVSAAGTLVRAVSYLAYELSFIVCVLEHRRKYLVFVTILFVSSSALELLLGFRGKVFLLLVTLWYLNNLKKGAKFRLVPLAATVTILSLLAVLVAGFRENRQTEMLTPVAFIAGQGQPIGITETAVEYRQLFQRHAMNYLFYSFEAPYIVRGVFKQGQFFDDDLSIFLNRNAFLNGYGFGSSYLAEAYIAGGAWLTIIASFGIGAALRFLHKGSERTTGGVLLALFLPALIYMPRSGLLEPVATGIKSLFSVLIICFCLWIIRGGKEKLAGSIHRLACLSGESRSTQDRER